MTGGADFARDFKRLTGYPPFHWQERLYRDHFEAGHVPTALDLPTGLGKTSVMAIWLVARAFNPKLPRRLVYVVDRRAVVDQATQFAEELRKNARAVLALDDLPISTLRGQFVDNREWLENPARPAIIVGTIDMIGSRLLFEGYGVSRRMRPYQAGLLGADTLVVLDEAHLCPPFEALLGAIATQEELKPKGERRRPIVPPFHVLPLSATGRNDGSKPFRLEPADTDPATQSLVHQRFTARKRLSLRDLPESATLAETLAERAWTLGQGGKRVIVYCHSRDVAQKVAGGLTGRAKASPELLVGARRVHERQKLVNRLQELGFSPPLPGAEPPARCETPAFLVATSAGEVGVDLDADHMVCDLVAYERMVQRLGRVNRRGGEEREAIIDVFCEAPEPPKADAKDEAKKKRAGAKFELCRASKAVLTALPLGEDGRHDASPKAFVALKAARPDMVEKATTPEPLRPALDRAVVDAWSLTSLRDHPGRPEPAPWLRGWVEDDEPQAEVIWRRWLPWRKGDERPDREEVESYFEVARPHPSEILQTYVSKAVDTLIERAVQVQKLAGDGESDDPAATRSGIIVLTPAQELKGSKTAAALRSLSDKGKKRERDDLERLLANATVVVSASLGGLDENGLLDPDATEPPKCLDDGWTGEELAAIGFRMLGPNESANGVGEWREVFAFSLTKSDEAESEHLTVVVSRGPRTPQVGDLAVSRRAQELDEHGEWTAGEARTLADALGLDDDHRAMLIAAARAHDLGKNRDLWQNAMGAPRDKRRPYAKTTGKGDPARLKIGGWTYRHEFGSLKDVSQDPVLLKAVREDLHDLALHLIAAHHGFARPVIAPVDPDAPPLQSEAHARDAALRFARLQREWGPWGLAWWEAILRAADQRASRLLNEEGA